MNQDQTVFSPLMELLPLKAFQNCVKSYPGHSRVRSFSYLDPYLCRAFALLTGRESVRDIEACLRSMQSKRYHMGIRGPVSRSPLADATERRDWRIYADFAQILIAQARELYAHDPWGVDHDQTVYAFDSTPIDLCLALFPGRGSGNGRARSSCLHGWIGGPTRRSSRKSPAEKSTMSMSSIP